MGHPWQFYHGEVLIFSWSCYAEKVKRRIAMDTVKIGKYIAGKRKALGMTQAQVAEKLGMSDKSVFQVGAGHLSAGCFCLYGVV